MDVKHTPGPWSVFDHGIWDISIKAEGTVCHINNKGDWFPREGSICGRSQNRMLADARLIAAAPDMLQMLRVVERYFNTEDPNPVLQADIAEVIAKATEEFA